MTDKEIAAETARAVKRAAEAQVVIEPEFKTIFGEAVNSAGDVEAAAQ